MLRLSLLSSVTSNSRGKIPLQLFYLFLFLFNRYLNIRTHLFCAQWLLRADWTSRRSGYVPAPEERGSERDSSSRPWRTLFHAASYTRLQTEGKVLLIV
ncbi:hypothetical protein TNIN_269181 [Trichonephila inaurata madagascariensis]|uniref:Uncharacterized protein n=1 Tax=Trichonephila inaurata madagascariensis TaxID=2747483 RepID=A0A8X6XTH5_9ARAC|nr:hypothetical protein TNIN_269181 [Trichonephila inaurata madagascariensis]